MNLYRAAGMPLLHTAAGDVSPVEVSAEILRELRIRAEQTWVVSCRAWW